MRVTIEVREDWIFDVVQATGDNGTNDAEHELLMEVADQVRESVLMRLKASVDG